MVRLLVHQANKEDIFEDMVRVHTSHRSPILAGKIFRVTSSNGTTLAVARNTPKNDRSGIWMDDEMRRRLQVTDGEKEEFTFKAIHWWENFVWLWSVSNPTNRVAAHLSFISLGLGVIGLILGVVSIWPTGK
ncbi:MAG: hypothetical protein HY242_02755 [Afipia sp.]|nr:hypothetical protein [Afipia sp.]